MFKRKSWKLEWPLKSVNCCWIKLEIFRVNFTKNYVKLNYENSQWMTLFISKWICFNFLINCIFFVLFLEFIYFQKLTKLLIKKNPKIKIIFVSISENPDDIYPYATFVLPEADCGAGNGTKVQITAYQQTPDSIRQQIMLNQQDTLMSSQPHISTLVFQEQSTLPLSDACSKSVR